MRMRTSRLVPDLLNHFCENITGPITLSSRSNKMKRPFGLLCLLLSVGTSSVWAQLHGYCAGVGQCVDNGTNSPTTTNPPSNFGFTISPGPQTGDLSIDVLVPNNEPK